MNQEELDLIKGVFTSDEAKDILLTLIDNKIKFHNEKIFSDNVRFGLNNEESVHRIKELKALKLRISDILAKCESGESKVSIHSQIIIETLTEKEGV
ncbi:MAG: hypothetical protein RIA69_06830 [Cyclobacteriaceae bacterium]